MCDDSDPAPADQSELWDVQTRWSNLVTNQMQTLTVELDSQKLSYRVFLFGSEMDPMASNLPESVDNSLIVNAEDLLVVAGQTVQMELDVRTTDGSKRSNRWFENLKADIVCRFDGEQVKYESMQGTQKGRYVISFTPFVAGTNSIALEVTGLAFKNRVPKLVVVPDEIHRISLVDSALRELPEIASQSVDEDFVQLFSARDRFDNRIALDENSRQSCVFIRDAFRPRTKDGSLDMRFSLNKGQDKHENFIQAYGQSFTAEGLLKITTDSKIPTEYSIQFSPNVSKKYVFNLLQGRLSAQKSSGKVASGKISRAGESARVSIRPRDQFGNSLVLDEALLSSANLTYSFADSRDRRAGEAPLRLQIADDAQEIAFEQQLTKSDLYKFSVQMGASEIQLEQSEVKIVSNDEIQLNNCELSYVDPTREARLSPDATEELQSTKFSPTFKLVAFDIYNNTLETFPESQKSLFALSISGDVYTGEAAIRFTEAVVEQNHLLLTLNAENLQKYRNALDLEYALNLSYNLQSQAFAVRLLGDSAETYTNAPFTLDSVRLVPAALETLAGAWNTVQVRFESPDQKLFHFSSTNGYFENAQEAVRIASSEVHNVTVSNGNQKGTYDVKFLVTKAEQALVPFQVQFAGKLQEIAQALSLKVSPAEVSQLLISDPTQLAACTAGDQRTVRIAPHDSFNNRVEDFSVDQLNLDLEPELGSRPSSSQKNKEVLYLIHCN